MKGGYLFHQPVDPVKYNILDYNEIIVNPMDFGTIKVIIMNYNSSNSIMKFMSIFSNS